MLFAQSSVPRGALSDSLRTPTAAHSLSGCDVPGRQPGRSALVDCKVSQPSRFCLQNAPTPELPVSPTLPISRSLSLPKCPSQLTFSRLLLPRGKQGGDFFGPQAPKQTKETRPTRAFRFPLNCPAPRSALPPPPPL